MLGTSSHGYLYFVDFIDNQYLPGERVNILFQPLLWEDALQPQQVIGTRSQTGEEQVEDLAFGRRLAPEACCFNISPCTSELFHSLQLHHIAESPIVDFIRVQETITFQ